MDWRQMLESLKLLLIWHVIFFCRRTPMKRIRGNASCNWLKQMLQIISKNVSANALKERYIFLHVLVTYNLCVYTIVYKLHWLQAYKCSLQEKLIKFPNFNHLKKRKKLLYNQYKETMNNDFSDFHSPNSNAMEIYITTKIENDFDDVYMHNLSTFSEFPRDITLKPGIIFKIAKKFRYCGDGTTDVICCATCSSHVSGWSTSDTEVVCEYCASHQYINIMNIPPIGSTSSRHASNTGGEQAENNGCQGACSDRYCRGCHTVTQTEFGQLSIREDLLGNQPLQFFDSSESSTRSVSNIVIDDEDEPGPVINLHNQTGSYTEDNSLFSTPTSGGGSTPFHTRNTYSAVRSTCRSCAATSIRDHRAMMVDSSGQPNRSRSTRTNPTSERIQRRRPNTDGTVLRLQPLGIFKFAARFTYFVTIASRLSSFSLQLPSRLNHQRERFAIAGFFFTGPDDCVCCFYCGVKLYSWGLSDDPWVEHAHWSPLCAYLRANKGDSFVCRVYNGDQEEEMNREDESSREGDQDDEGNRQGGHDNEGSRLGGQENEDSRQGGQEDEGSRQGGQEDEGSREHDQHGDSDYSQEIYSQNNLSEDLEEENNRLKGQLMCMICEECPVSIVFLPCGHFGCCAECAKIVSTCPACRTNIEDKIAVTPS